MESYEDLVNLDTGIETMPEVDSTLTNDSSETNPLNENPLVEDSSSSEKDELKERPSKSVDSTTNSNLTSVPLKKRAVAQAAAETVKVRKKIVLNRNNIPTPRIVITSKPTVPLKTVITMNKTESSTNDGKQHEDGKDESAKEGKIMIGMSKSPAKSELEKLALRAERFKTAGSKEKSKPDVSSPSFATAATSKVSSTSSYDYLTSVEAMKRRAERFGQNTSSVMKKMEDKERVLKRKAKFGGIGTGNGISAEGDDEKKKKRAERFGI